MTKPKFFCLIHSQTLGGEKNTITSWPAIAPFHFMLNWRPPRCSGSVHRRWKKMFACEAVRSALSFKPTLHLGQNTPVGYVRQLIAERTFMMLSHRPHDFKNSWHKVHKEKCFLLLHPSAGTDRSTLLYLSKNYKNFHANIATDWFPVVVINIWHVFSSLPLSCSRTPPYCLVLSQQEVHPVDPQTAQKQSGPSVVMS